MGYRGRDFTEGHEGNEAANSAVKTVKDAQLARNRAG
jgi:hypothetical protein